MSVVQAAPQESAEVPRSVSIVDCDIHPTLTVLGLQKRVSSRWRGYLERFGRRTPNITEFYPRTANAGFRLDSWPQGPDGFPGSDLELLRTQLLDECAIDYGILNSLGLLNCHEVPELAAEIARALNDWMTEWMDQEPRLLGALVVPYEYPDLAVAEIERCAGDRRWVQLILPDSAEDPLGSHKYWPVYEAAVAHGLPVAVHTAGYWPHLDTGWPSYYLEEHVANSLRMTAQLANYICEGTFDAFPELRIVLTEAGVAWSAPLMWALDNAWELLAEGDPGLERRPSEILPRAGVVHDPADRGARRPRRACPDDPPRRARGPAPVCDRLPALGLRLADPGAAAVAWRRAASQDPRRQRLRALRPTAHGRRVIDCDVHCAPTSLATLAPYLSDYWREYTPRRASASAACPRLPADAPTTGGPAPGDYDTLANALFADGGPRYAILNCLTICEAHRNPYYQAALASALNDWIRQEFLDRDERLRASMVVSTVDPDDALAEIERLGATPFRPGPAAGPRRDAYGNRRYQRDPRGGRRRGLAIALHAWGGRPGADHDRVPLYLPRGLRLQPDDRPDARPEPRRRGRLRAAPRLRVACRGGFAWMPSLLWRFDKDWKGCGGVPWVKERPSAYMRRHFRATTAPAHLPAQRPEVIRELVAMMGPELLMHASDHPHNHGAGAAALYEALSDEECEGVGDGNAAAFYRLNGAAA